jgi:predicted Zn-dependent peptidase
MGSADVDPVALPLALETVRTLLGRDAPVPFDGAALDRVRWAEARESNLRVRTTRDLARALFVRWALGWPLATLDEVPAQLEAATLGDVEAALRTCRASAVVSVVGDAPSLAAAGVRN